MRIFRVAVVAAIMLNLALLAAVGPLQTLSLRYALAQKRRELRDLRIEHQALLHETAVARRPDRVMARALALGIDLRPVENGRIVRTPGEGRPVANAPRR